MQLTPPSTRGAHFTRGPSRDIAQDCRQAARKPRDSRAGRNIDNGKPIRETRNADIPLSIDHFRYFAAVCGPKRARWANSIRIPLPITSKSRSGSSGRSSLEFPLLMAAWKLAPAIGAGNCVVIKPASNTPLSLLIMAGLVADILPPGVLNVVTGPGGEIGKALASNPRIAKIAFTGETPQAG